MDHLELLKAYAVAADNELEQAQSRFVQFNTTERGSEICLSKIGFDSAFNAGFQPLRLAYTCTA